MKNTRTLIVWCCLLMAFSCKKDTQPQPQPKKNGALENGLLSLSVNGQLVDAVIDTTFNTILVTISSSVNQHALTVNFTLANQVGATINNAAVNSGATLDLSAPLIFKVADANGDRSSSFTLMAQTEMEYFGIPGAITSQNNLNKNYDYYFDQFDGSPFASINCGPTSTTMAIKWADSAFTGQPVDARHLFSPLGGWWYTGDIQGYLFDNGINSAIDTLADLNALVKSTIDNGYALILNPDMNYISYNDNVSQHVGKFYATTPGWGHYFLVKGYVQTKNFFFLDVYDPYSQGIRYGIITIGQLEGKDRYYSSDDVKMATKNWWPYAIIIAPKGKKVIAATHLTVNSLGKTKAIPQGYGR